MLLRVIYFEQLVNNNNNNILMYSTIYEALILYNNSGS